MALQQQTYQQQLNMKQKACKRVENAYETNKNIKLSSAKVLHHKDI
jgi:hypothetical protein